MISKLKCVVLVCDNCEYLFENYSGFTIFLDKESAIEDATEDGWETNQDSKHYCPDCFHYNDDDRLVLNESREGKFKK
jgi:hypothetical protein